MFLNLKNLGADRFDTRYGLYFEESDLCSRLARKGYGLYHVPLARVKHLCGASMKGLPKSFDAPAYYRTRNKLLWGTSNLSGIKLAVFWWHVCWRYPFKLVITLMKGKKGEFKAMAKAFADFSFARFGMLPSAGADKNLLSGAKRKLQKMC
jgi:GT2 family glycosyltransferase